MKKTNTQNMDRHRESIAKKNRTESTGCGSRAARHSDNSGVSMPQIGRQADPQRAAAATTVPHGRGGRDHAPPDSTALTLSVAGTGGYVHAPFLALIALTADLGGKERHVNSNTQTQKGQESRRLSIRRRPTSIATSARAPCPACSPPAVRCGAESNGGGDAHRTS